LVANAIKFTRDGGQVVVSATPGPDGVLISVHDSGPGIAEEQLPHLFDRFWQASRDDGRGLGLGLSIVKAIVEAHGGRVEVRSVLKQGSTFCIILPRAESRGTVDMTVRSTARPRSRQRTGAAAEGAVGVVPLSMLAMKSQGDGDASRS
jgi:K+-sensing histidine kinase KdpD